MGFLADSVHVRAAMHAGIGLDYGMAPNRQQDIIWTNADPIHLRIYAAQEGDELKKRNYDRRNMY